MRGNIKGRLSRLEAEVPTDPPVMACFWEGEHGSRAEMYESIEEWKRENPNHCIPMVVCLESPKWGGTVKRIDTRVERLEATRQPAAPPHKGVRAARSASRVGEVAATAS